MRVERDGLGYAADIPEEGIRLHIDRLTESRGELTGELTVQRAPDGHLMRARFNLVSQRVRSDTAKFLATRSSGVDWTSLLETFSLRVLDLERRGEPATLIGNRPPRGAPDWLLRPLLLRGVATLIYGEGGTGKSTFTAALAVSVATGVPLLEGWEVTSPCPVLVLDWEADGDDWNDIVAAICAGMNVPQPAIYHLPCGQSLPAQLHRIAREVGDKGAGLVIVDSVGLATPSAREGTDANESALRLFSALRVLGVTSLLIDHVAKSAVGNEGSAMGPYGSIYKTNSARAVYELRAAPEPDPDGSRHLALIHRKGNRTAKQPTQGIKVTRDDQHIYLEAEPVDGSPRLASTLSLAERIRRTLLEERRPMTAKELATYLEAGAAVINTTLIRATSMFVRVGTDGRENLWGVISNTLDNNSNNAPGMSNTRPPFRGVGGALDQHPRAEGVSAA